MPIHDWTLVDPPAFHDMHQSWMFTIKAALRGGLLPAGYYAHLERHFGKFEADVLTLSQPSPDQNAAARAPGGGGVKGGVALAVRPPKAGARLSATPVKQATVTIRRVGTDRVVALIELASPSNKDRSASVKAYTEKAKAALDAGVHLVHLDMLPPTPHTPGNLSTAVWEAADGVDYPFDPLKPFAADAIMAGRVNELYANPLGLGDEWPVVPLFLDEDTYIEMPLEATYALAYETVAPQDQDVLAHSLPGNTPPQAVS